MIAATVPFLLLAAFAVPWFLLLRARTGSVVGALTVFILGPILILITFTVSSLVTLDPVLFTLIVAAIVGIGGVFALRKSGVGVLRPSRAALATVAGASLGGVVWMSTIAVARLAPDTAVVSWAMRGDSANHIHLMRDMIAGNGFVFGSSRNQVPLQNELMTIATWIGRPDAPLGTQLEHDIIALSTVWMLAIAAFGVFAGVIAASAVQSASALRTGIASASGSLLVTTWFFVGLPIDSGYYNVHVALPFALSCWLAFRESPRHPIAATLLLLGGGVLLLTTWSPLVIFPVFFIAAIAARNWARVKRAGGPAAVPIAIGIGLFVTILFVIYFPTLARGLSTLRLPGHGYPFTIAIFAIGVLGLVGALVALRSAASTNMRDGVIALTTAGGAGIALLVLIARDQTIPWLSYYPTKLTWLATVVCLIVVLSLIFALVDRIPSRRLATTLTALIGVAALAISTVGPLPSREDFDSTQPLDTVLTGEIWTGGRPSLDRITNSLNRDDIVLLWDSGVTAEAFVNFWVLDFSGAGARDGNDFVRGFSVRGYQNLRDRGINSPTQSIEFLCELPDYLDRPLTVQTADTTLSTELATACPSSSITVEAVAPLP